MRFWPLMFIVTILCSFPFYLFQFSRAANDHVTLSFSMTTLGLINFAIGRCKCKMLGIYIKDTQVYNIWCNFFSLTNRQSFTMHLLRLMTSWAVVCDVWYLEPQYLQPGETAIEFAERYWAFVQYSILAFRYSISKFVKGCSTLIYIMERFRLFSSG